MTTLVIIAIFIGNLLITLGFLVLMGRPLAEGVGLQSLDDKLSFRGVPVIVTGIALTCSPLVFAVRV